MSVAGVHRRAYRRAAYGTAAAYGVGSYYGASAIQATATAATAVRLLAIGLTRPAIQAMAIDRYTPPAIQAMAMAMATAGFSGHPPGGDPSRPLALRRQPKLGRTTMRKILLIGATLIEAVVLVATPV